VGEFGVFDCEGLRIIGVLGVWHFSLHCLLDDKGEGSNEIMFLAYDGLRVNIWFPFFSRHKMPEIIPGSLRCRARYVG